MIRVGLLSDAHRQTALHQTAIEKLKEEGAHYLIHAGDLVIEENLAMLHHSNLPYVSVFGNNDAPLLSVATRYKIEKEPYCFKIEEVKCKLMHMPYYLTPDCDVVIFGHTHSFHSEYKKGTLFINPGEVCAREKRVSECAMLEIYKDRYRVVRYERPIEQEEWKESEINYAK
jgi:putative phosphoesterase